jgi:O-antigen/teichoic acid export membrane protein
MFDNLSRRAKNALQDVRQTPLLSRAVSGSFVSLAGSGVGQFLRFVANTLVLSRLLEPDAFGLMNLVMTFIQGLRMLSDVGIGPSVIQSPRGEEPTFLRTAWSLQVVRGFALFAASILLAWPFASFYRHDEHRSQLLVFIPIAGIQAILNGFNSTTLFVLQRRLLLVKRVTIDLAAQIVGIVVMITWALISPTPWSLLAGGLAESACLLLISHWVQPRLEHRFGIDRREAHDMLRFGRWVFFATAFTFGANKADRFINSLAFDFTSLGVYSAAIAMATLLPEMIRDLASRVLFPLFARWSVDDRDVLRRRILRTRIVFALATTVPMVVLCLAGNWIVQVLYKDRPSYWDAGPWLQVLAAGVRGATQDEHPTVAVLEERCDRVGAEVWVHRHGIGAVPHERFDRVLLGGGADVAALGVEDEQRVRLRGPDVCAELLELILGAVGGKVCDLGLERAR